MIGIRPMPLCARRDKFQGKLVLVWFACFGFYYLKYCYLVVSYPILSYPINLSINPSLGSQSTRPERTAGLKLPKKVPICDLRA